MPRRGLWLTVAKGVFGFAAGLAIWWALTPAYAGPLASGATFWIRLFERPAVTRLRPEDKQIIVERSDFPPRSARPGIPSNDLTFNFILMSALFAANPRTFSNANVVRYLGGCAILAVTHVLAMIVEVQSIYALKLGPWSAAHYGPVARNFWGASSHFYRVVGLYAIAFAIWWFLRPDEASGEPAPRKRKRK